MPNNNVSIIGHFREDIQISPPEFMVTVASSNWAYGTASASRYIAITPAFEGAGVMAAPGELIHITADVFSGYVFERWEVISGGVVIGDSSWPVTSFNMPSADVSIIAHFREYIPIVPTEFTVTVSVNNWAYGAAVAFRRVSFMPIFEGTELIATPGTRIYVIAEAFPGHIFERWEVISGGVVIENIFSSVVAFTMQHADVYIRAYFSYQLQDPTPPIWEYPTWTQW